MGLYGLKFSHETIEVIRQNPINPWTKNSPISNPKWARTESSRHQSILICVIFPDSEARKNSL